MITYETFFFISLNLSARVSRWSPARFVGSLRDLRRWRLACVTAWTGAPTARLSGMLLVALGSACHTIFWHPSRLTALARFTRLPHLAVAPRDLASIASSTRWSSYLCPSSNSGNHISAAHSSTPRWLPGPLVYLGGSFGSCAAPRCSWWTRPSLCGIGCRQSPRSSPSPAASTPYRADPASSWAHPDTARRWLDTLASLRAQASLAPSGSSSCLGGAPSSCCWVCRWYAGACSSCSLVTGTLLNIAEKIYY